MQELVEILREDAESLEREFRKASTLGKGTPQEVSEFRENAFRSFISRFFPAPYRAVKGKIFDSYGNGPSASVDCVVVNPVHPHLIDAAGKFQLLLADAVDLAIEVKPTLADNSELIRGLRQGVSVKKLRRIKGPMLLPQGKPDHVVEAFRQIPFFLFSMEAKTQIEQTVEDIENWYRENKTSLTDQIDAIAIPGIGILNHLKHQDFFIYEWDIPAEYRTGWFLESWGDTTLLGLLLRLEFSFHSTATVQESVLRRYIKSIKIPNIRRIAG